MTKTKKVNKKEEKPDWVKRNEEAKKLEQMDPKERNKSRRQKMVDQAFEYPFCRRCQKKLDPKWVEALKEEGALPLCKECYPKMMDKFEDNIKKFHEMFAQ